MTSIDSQKQQVRNLVRDRLNSLSSDEVASKSKAACENLISTEEYKSASVVMLYLSLPLEVDTAGIFLDAWQTGKQVVVPKISWEQRHMIPVEINSLDTGLKKEKHGLRTPVKSIPVPIEDIDLIVTPGLGFDLEGNRLGKGGSFYDRFFNNSALRAKRFAIAFDEQLVKDMPTDKHDKKIDCLITDKTVNKF